jgi:hypothetical protein
VFARQVRCPRCKANDTAAYRTKGEIQYRACQRPICRKRFSVKGTPADAVDPGK